MGKKKGAKKSGGDDFWDEAGESAGPATQNGEGGHEDDASVPARKSAFAAMTLEDDADDKETSKNGSSKAVLAEEEDDDFGGLMSTIKKNDKKKDKKGKKGKKQQDDDIWDELGEDVSGNAAHTDGQKSVDEDDKSAQVASTADEFPEDGTDNSKAEKSSSHAVSDTVTPTKADKDEEEEEEGDENPHRVLTKKEKEKLKKEKEKAKKKAQADAKKAAASDDITEETTVPLKEEKKDVPSVAGQEEEEGGEEGEDGEGANASDKKKKKKKKKAAETKAEPAATSGKKPSAALQALQARLAAQKKAEEEAKAEEEEARRREEEADRLEKEEADRKEADRQRRKDKEKAKREQLKKEGKLLTPKQKAEKASAEARMQAMIASGQVKIDGLLKRETAAQDSEEKGKKKVVYDSRKKGKKGPSGPPSKIDANLAPADEPKPVIEEEIEPEPVVEAEPPKEEPLEVNGEAADEEQEEEAADEDDIKDDWDAESGDEDHREGSKVKSTTKVNGKSSESAAATTTSTIKKKAPTTKETSASSGDSGSDEGSSGDDSDDDSDDDESSTVAQQMAAKKKAEADQRKKEKHEAALAATSRDNLRSPICCIMGHVDTGKTKLLDKIRQTNVQEGEAGGITQQIGATYFPVEVLKQKIEPIDPEGKQAFNTPGLLVIDTPGHESFTNLRTRGSSLCNIAILVVDIMHGLEPQTLESIRMLRDRKTPFIVALNKIDRLYGWRATPDGAFRDSLSKQDRATQNEFHDRYQKTVVAFAEQGLNAVLYYENKNFAKNVSLVPTSAHTGEGIPDMLQLLVNLTQDRMSEKLMYLSELECTVLEVKVIEGLGTTIDVILSNGVMYEGDKIVLCGLNGPIVTQVRALLTPQPLKEMRVKGTYVHHKMVKAALGVKISAPDLEKAISGSRLLVCGPDDDEDDLKEEVMSDLTGLLHSIDKSGKGVCVQASTLGSLEALLEFLKQSKIPVNGINIGPVYKKDVMRCATMLEKSPDLAVMLCFDVTIDKEAEKLAEEIGVKIFSARIIYHLFDSFLVHQKQVLERKQKENSGVAVWPCRLKILAVFAKRSPLILGCEIIQGDLRMDTPIAVKNKTTGEVVNLGRVTSLEVNHKRMDVVTAKSAGAGVAVRIECAAHEAARTYGRHFTDEDELFSLISRQSIDSLKEFFWDGMTIEQKKTIKHLKTVLQIA
ncbi:hypothetical protein CBS101457_003872 [Exobasidium rhododendri]|nr:hypothetical protein CBS101457_003872 [Exobasidium rhododendri]